MTAGISAAALLEVPVDDRAQRIDIVQEDVLDPPCGGIDVARHADIDDEERVVPAAAHHRLHVVRSDDVRRTVDGRDHDVRHPEPFGHLFVVDNLPAEFGNERLRAGAGPVRHADSADPLSHEVLQGQLARFSCTDEQRRFAGKVGKDLAGEFHGGIAHRNGAFADRGLRAHALADMQPRPASGDS